MDRWDDDQKRADLRFGRLALLVAQIGGAKRADGAQFAISDIYPSLQVTASSSTPQQRAAEQPSVDQQDAIALAWDGWARRQQAIAQRLQGHDGP